MRKMLLICVCGILCLCLAGCDGIPENTMYNIEQRDYATILIADGAEDGSFRYDLGIAKERRKGESGQTEEVVSYSCADLDELSKLYENHAGKALSLSHLKVILLTDRLSAQQVQTVLCQLDDSKEIAKTCPVLRLHDRESFLKYLKDAEEPVGTYISGLIRIREREGMDVPWLKDYLRVLREGDEITVCDLSEDERGLYITDARPRP